MHKKFEINWIKIMGGCQSERKVVTHDSKSDLTLVQAVCMHRLASNVSLSASGLCVLKDSSAMTSSTHHTKVDRAVFSSAHRCARNFF